MKIKPIRTKKDYNNALIRVEEIWDAKIGTKKGDELDILAILIEKYEEENFHILPPDPIEAIKFRMDQMNLKRKDLIEIIGANRVSEIFQRKRGLSLKMIRNLHTVLNIPVESLISTT